MIFSGLLKMKQAAIFRCSAFSPPTGDGAAEHRRPTRALGAHGRGAVVYRVRFE